METNKPLLTCGQVNTPEVDNTHDPCEGKMTSSDCVYVGSEQLTEVIDDLKKQINRLKRTINRLRNEILE